MTKARTTAAALAAALALAGCGGGGSETAGNNISAVADPEGNAAVLPPDEALADEAAADEAADIAAFGGNAAAGETTNTGNSQ